MVLPIVLGVTRVPAKGRASSFLSQPADSAAVRSSVLRRDQYSCRYCAFKSQKYQQVQFVNGDVRDWRSENLVTACIFCQQCASLEKVALMRSGVLIWLPEFSQAALNHVVRSIYIARISPGQMADAGRAALQALTDRREQAKQRLGTDDPGTLSTVLQDYLEDDDYDHVKVKMDGLRLLPLDRRIIHEADIEFNQFPQILAYWRSKDGPFNGLLPATWGSSFEELAAKVAA